MKSQSFVITDAQGLHARPCASIVAAVRNFDSTVTMTYQGTVFDASNPIALMTAGVACNDEIIFTVSGNDEDKAMESLEELIKKELT
mgnify:CR=1 FL=1